MNRIIHNLAIVFAIVISFVGASRVDDGKLGTGLLIMAFAALLGAASLLSACVAASKKRR
jgi:hypothetical protein